MSDETRPSNTNACFQGKTFLLKPTTPTQYCYSEKIPGPCSGINSINNDPNALIPNTNNPASSTASQYGNQFTNTSSTGQIQVPENSAPPASPYCNNENMLSLKNFKSYGERSLTSLQYDHQSTTIEDSRVTPGLKLESVSQNNGERLLGSLQYDHQSTTIEDSRLTPGLNLGSVPQNKGERPLGSLQYDHPCLTIQDSRLTPDPKLGSLPQDNRERPLGTAQFDHPCLTIQDSRLSPVPKLGSLPRDNTEKPLGNLQYDHPCLTIQDSRLTPVTKLNSLSQDNRERPLVSAQFDHPCLTIQDSRFTPGLKLGNLPQSNRERPMGSFQYDHPCLTIQDSRFTPVQNMGNLSQENTEKSLGSAHYHHPSPNIQVAKITPVPKQSSVPQSNLERLFGSLQYDHPSGTFQAGRPSPAHKLDNLPQANGERSLGSLQYDHPSGTVQAGRPSPAHKLGNLHQANGERSFGSLQYDHPCPLQVGGRLSSVPKPASVPHGDTFNFSNRYGYHSTQQNKLYDKFVLNPANNSLKGNAYHPGWNMHSTREIQGSSPYDIYKNQNNPRLISNHNAYTADHSFINLSKHVPTFSSYPDHQRTQTHAYKTGPGQDNFNNMIKNNRYGVFQGSTPQPNIYNIKENPSIYQNQRDVPTSVRSNVCIPYKKSLNQMNAFTNHCSVTGDLSVAKNSYGHSVDQKNENTGQMQNLYGDTYTDGFKPQDSYSSHGSLYRPYPDTYSTPVTQKHGSNFYDSYAVPLGIPLTYQNPQPSVQTLNYRVPSKTFNAARERGRFPRQGFANRPPEFENPNPHYQGQQYVVLRQIKPERREKAEQCVRVSRVPQGGPKTTKRVNSDVSAVAPAKSKQRPTLPGNTGKTKAAGQGRNLEERFRYLISGEDVLLSKHVVDDEGPIAKIEGDSFKKKRKTPKRVISSRWLKSVPRTIRDTEKVQGKTSMRYGKRVSSGLGPRPSDGVVSARLNSYLWSTDFRLEEASDVMRPPSSLFLRPRAKGFFEGGPDDNPEETEEGRESDWFRSESLYEETDYWKPAWKILILEPLFQNLVY